MRSIWHSLAWKEWHEHKWKLASIVAIMWSLAALVVIASSHERQMLLEAYQVSLIFGALPLTVFLGLGVAAGERSHGTLRFLQALPVPLWHVALHKIAFGLLSVIIPIILTLLLITVLHRCLLLIGFDASAALPKEEGPFSGNWGIDIALVATVVAASLFIWAAACGVNRIDEISAGAMALAVMVGWWLLLIIFWGVLLMGSFGVETARLRAVGVASAPMGLLMLADIAGGNTICILLGLTSAVLTHGALTVTYVARFGRTGDSEFRSPQIAVRESNRTDWLAPPRRLRLTAIAWKQMRESVPIVLAGLAGIVAIVISYFIAERFTTSDWPTEPGLIYSGVAIVFGFFIALIVGIGVSLPEVAPRLNTFWRSRPIQPDLWFWCKYATGMVIVLASIYGPIALIAALGHSSVSEGVKNSEMIALPLGQMAVFAAAVAMTCLVRHAIYAAILSIPLAYSDVVLVWIASRAAALIGWLEDSADELEELSVSRVALGLFISLVISTLIAWLAMRYDWGRKSRY